MTKQIKISDILCQSNRDDGNLASLIDAIKATGGKLLQPILLKNSRSTKLYEVVDGRRRFQALELMKREYLEENEYTFAAEDLDGEVCAYIANTERKALSPLEEAKQICDMLKSMTAEEIAEKLGKTLHYVVSRSRLAELTGKWQQVLAEPDKYPQWTIGKLQMIAREPETIQKEIDHLIENNYTISELWNRISHYHRKLAEAPFSWKDVCRACEKRSDRQGVLFEEDQTEATCLDSECFQNMCFKGVQKTMKDRPELTPVRSSGTDYDSDGRKWADKNKVPAVWETSYTEVDNEAEATGIICCGERIGRLVKITNTRQVKTSADTAAEAKAERQKKEETKKQREILRIAMQKFADQIDKIKKWDNIPPDRHENIWRMIFTIGIPRIGYEFHFEEMYQPAEGAVWADIALQKVMLVITGRIRMDITHPQLDVNRTFEKELCKVFTWDWETLFFEPAKKEYETQGKKK